MFSGESRRALKSQSDAIDQRNLRELDVVAAAYRKGADPRGFDRKRISELANDLPDGLFSKTYPDLARWLNG